MLKRSWIAVLAAIGAATALLVYGTAGAVKTLPTATSASSAAAGGPVAAAAKKQAKKKLTRAQKLAKALKACKKEKSKSKRKACEKSAHKKYAVGHHPTKEPEPMTTATTGTTGAGTTATGTAATGTTAGATATGTIATGTGTATTTGTTVGTTTGTTAGTTTGTTAGTTTGTTAGTTTGTTTGGKTPAEMREEAEVATLAKEAPSNTQPAAHVSAGMALYDSTCSTCHGLHGEGEHEGPALTGLPRSESVKGVIEQLIKPLGGMPDYDENYTFVEKEELGAYVCVELTKKCTG